jgi:hypothetical protein
MSGRSARGWQVFKVWGSKFKVNHSQTRDSGLTAGGEPLWNEPNKPREPDNPAL